MIARGVEAPRLAYVGPTYRQTKDIAWEFLKRETLGIPGREINETELRVDLPGAARIRLYGAENYEALRGIYFNDVAIDEAAQLDPKAWSEVIRPALSDRKGSATFITTPKGRNWFHRFCYGDPDTGFEGALHRDDWFTLVLRASTSGILDADELADARRTMTQEEYDQEYECSFDAAARGAYYAAEFRRIDKDGRIRSVPVDRYAAVDTAWDLGRGHSTDIWFFQRAGREVHVVDYYSAEGVGLDHYARVLREKEREREWKYGEHYLPHDVRVTELTTDLSRLATLESLGVKPVIVVPQHNVDDGINAVRRMLDRCWFDRVRCQPGIDHLRQYRVKFDKSGRISLGQADKTEGHDHAADAFRMYATMFQDVTPEDLRRYGRGDRRRRTREAGTWMSA